MTNKDEKLKTAKDYLFYGIDLAKFGGDKTALAFNLFREIIQRNGLVFMWPEVEE